MNLLLITFDSLRYDFTNSQSLQHLSLSTDAFSWLDSTVEFKAAFTASPYTWGAFASLLASAYPQWVTTPQGVLLPDVLVLPEVLQHQGFKTAAFNSNPFISAGFGYARGFDVFEDGLLAKQAARIPRTAYTYLAKLTRLIRRTPYMPAPEVTRLAINWLKKQISASTPFFVWVHYMDTHGPYQSKQGFTYLNKIRAERLWRKAVSNSKRITPSEQRELLESYAEEVAYVDRYLGLLLKELEVMGIADNTIIILCADHGDGFGEHGFYSHPRHLYEELVHIPLLVRHPALDKRRVIKTPVGLIDLAPTVLDMLGLSVQETGFVGQSLWPAMLTGDTSYLHGWVVMDATPDRSKRIVGIRTERWKLIVNQEKNTKELYDLSSDPDERSNVAALYPSIVEDLESRLWAELERRSPPQELPEIPEPVIDEEILQRLRGLGYIE